MARVFLRSWPGCIGRGCWRVTCREPLRRLPKALTMAIGAFAQQIVRSYLVYVRVGLYAAGLFLRANDPVVRFRPNPVPATNLSEDAAASNEAAFLLSAAPSSATRSPCRSRSWRRCLASQCTTMCAISRCNSSEARPTTSPRRACGRDRRHGRGRAR